MQAMLHVQCCGGGGGARGGGQGGGNPEVMGMRSLQEAGYPTGVSREKNFLQHYAHTGGNHYGRGWEP